MAFIVEAFSWGRDVAAPDIQTHEEANLQAARNRMNQQWEVPGCFHVRILSKDDDRFHLHSMKSRPTNERDLQYSFEKIPTVDGVKNVRAGNEIDVLRVCDFADAVPVGQINLPATSFFGYFLGGGRKQIGNGSPGLNLQNLEVCLAAAAYIPNEMAALIPQGDDWYFLSEVDVSNGEARLFFEST